LKEKFFFGKKEKKKKEKKLQKRRRLQGSSSLRYIIYPCAFLGYPHRIVELRFDFGTGSPSYVRNTTLALFPSSCTPKPTCPRFPHLKSDYLILYRLN
jgi:hypothetical protein